MARWRGLPTQLLIVPFVLLFFFLALDSLVDDSPTMDEQNHIARGLAFLRTGDPRLSLEHPPLVNALSALPLLTLHEMRLPTDHPSWEQRQGWYAFAEQLLWEYNDDVTRIVFLARIPILFLTLALALTTLRFARALWGKWPALLAAGLVLFDPNIIAHGRYSTTDVGFTNFVLMATFLLWGAWSAERWSWPRTGVAALGLGLALGSKFSSLAFLPALALLAVLPVHKGRWTVQLAGRRTLQLAASGTMALVVLWLIYGLEWGQFRFVSPNLVQLNEFSGPMPTFWAGIEQILDVTGGGRPSFLFGETRTTGFWHYFLVAFLVKTPLVVIVMITVATALLLWNRGSRQRALFLLTPVIVFFAVSMRGELNIGYRHLLPILPFSYILVGGVAKLPIARAAPGERLRRTAARGAPLALVSLLAADAITHPHYLSFFNLAAGGPSGGHRILIDSNIDWGQDLIRLKRWMEDQGVDRVKLAWFGTADPRYYGIEYDPLPGLPRHFDLWWQVPFDTAAPERGVYAISVSSLWELPLEEKSVFAWFRARQPDDRVGYSIYIYRVGSANRTS